jgi:glycosyltransferase involved in cell wall biosynthesis
MLVSCLTPTYNRRAFFPRAIKCFLAQDYPDLEWIILDDGQEPIQDLLPPDPRIKYFHQDARELHGAKMNRCFELSQGEVGIVFDDDDWYPANRISRQVAAFADPAIEITGSSTIYYYEHGAEKVWQYRSPTSIAWMASIAVRKKAWERLRFDNIQAGADYNIQRQVPATAKVDLADPALVVAAIHPANACKKHLSAEYTPVSWDTVKGFLNE